MFLRNKKSMIFAFDATLALMMAAILIIGTILYAAYSPDIKIISRQGAMQAEDHLAVLEKTNVLKQWTAGDSSGVQQYLAALPGSRCVNVSIYDANYLSISSAQNFNCSFDASKFTARRVFIANEKIAYIAEARVWYPK